MYVYVYIYIYIYIALLLISASVFGCVFRQNMDLVSWHTRLGEVREQEGIRACVISIRFFLFCVNGKATSDGSLCIYPDRGGCGSVHLNTPLNRIERPGYPTPALRG